MEYSTLYELIEQIERGTKLHVGVEFFGRYGCSECNLPHPHTIHSSAVCDFFKSKPRGLMRCIKCRSYAIRRARRDRQPFSALCINGVFEYTYPVVIEDETAAVIFIGNILTCEGEKKLSAMGLDGVPFDTMERNTAEEDCKKIARLLESYITLLVENTRDNPSSPDTVIERIKNYVAANIEYDLKLSDVASVFFFNEAYLGRLFFKKTGTSFNSYLNSIRIIRAKELLLSDMRVAEVAERVGYNSPSYFNRVFKEETGLTPGEYKLKNRLST